MYSPAFLILMFVLGQFSFLDLFTKLKQSGVTPDVYVYTAVLSSCVKSGNRKFADELYEEVITSGLFFLSSFLFGGVFQGVLA